MKFEIVGRPKFYFYLTKEEVDVLVSMSKAHYDGHCRAASMPKVGGFLNGWKNMVECTTEFNEPPLQLSASWDELDTVLKITEMCNQTVKNAEVASRLHWAFQRAMTAATRVAKQWTADIEV